jgi:hypothetical protein
VNIIKDRVESRQAAKVEWMIKNQWKEAFLRTVQHYENAGPLRAAALDERLADWTAYLTGAVVQTCYSLGWISAAKGNELHILPVPHCEYLTLDVMAFAPTPTSTVGWCFPKAVAELENSPDKERIAYSLWKVLCVRSDLRIVFCYRRSFADAPALISYLGRVVVKALPFEDRLNLKGETYVVVGSRNDSATFPYGFFKWWLIDNNTGNFNVM